MNIKDVFTASEVAHKTGLSSKHVVRLAQQWPFPDTLFRKAEHGGGYLFTKEAVEKIMQAKTGRTG